jgi:hypothetical protein
MRVKYSDVLERMKKSANLKNDSRLARLLGVTPQALSNYKKRSKVPSDLLIKFADMQGLSVDWLLTGEGPSSRVSSVEGASSVAAEYDVAYGMKSGMAVAGLMNFAGLSPDELIYVGRMIKVLRSADTATAAVLKWTIDAFERAVSVGSEAPAIPSGTGGDEDSKPDGGEPGL